MALSHNAPRRFESGVGPTFNELPVKDGVTVYAGGAYAVELASEQVYVPVGDDTAEVFVGFAAAKVVGDGTRRVRLRSEGIAKLDVAGVGGDDDIAKPVYATDDETFSLTDSGSDLVIGRVHRHVSGTTCMVHFAAASLRGADAPA